jgi:hypothetical protein
VRLGFSSTEAFFKWLEMHSFPTFGLLRDWSHIRVLHRRALQLGSLHAVANQQGCYSSILYRFVRRITGISWMELQKESEREVLVRCISVWVATRPRLLEYSGIVNASDRLAAPPPLRL